VSPVGGDLPFLHTRAAKFVSTDGQPVRLRGVCLGGWLNMENFITGYAANEALMRTTVGAVLGDERTEGFFDRLLSSFFAEPDAAFLGESGFNVARIPVNYRHLESDAAPFAVIDNGFAHLDRAINQLGAHGVYSIIDLHALPGSQNHHWHSDNATHRASFWEHPHFQDRVVNLWQAIATRYRDNPYVAGFNLMNEPADESRAVIGPYYRRLTSAIREIDTRHIIFLDGNTYATEFDFFDAAADNTVYTLHDYVPAGLGRGKGYPGTVDGVYYDKDAVLRNFMRRSAYARATGTPIFVGEFGPIYTGDAHQDEQRLQILDDQLDIYRDHDAGWSIWMYKDLGRQGLVTVQPESAYRRRFDEFVAKKVRLGADQWGSDGEGVVEVTRPVQELMAKEFPDFAPYPWGCFDWTRTLLLNIIMAQPLAYEYAEMLRGLDDSELDALTDSFQFEDCSVRTPLLTRLRAG
jgi:hypothetical protein